MKMPRLIARRYGALWYIGPASLKGGAMAGTFLQAWREYLKRTSPTGD